MPDPDLHEPRPNEAELRAPVEAGYVHRQRVARFGERLAARVLAEGGARILGRNLRVGRGEIDIHALIGGVSVAVEVKTMLATAATDDAIRRFSPSKAEKVRRYAARLVPPARRVDLVAVTIRPRRVDAHWIPFAG